MNGAGDIGGTAEVLPAGIYQQESVHAHTFASSARSFVVDYGAVGSVTHDGSETVGAEKRTLRPELTEPLARLPLGGTTPQVQLLLKPHIETHQCHPVFNHRPSEALYLYRVLHSLHGCYHPRRIALRFKHGSAETQQLVMTPRQRRRIEHHPLIATLRQRGVEIAVVPYLHTLVAQLMNHRHREFVAVYEQNGFIFGYQQV